MSALLNKWSNEDINRQPWRRAPRVACNLCDAPAAWLIKATGKTFAAESEGEDPIRLPDWRVFGCNDHLVELSDYGTAASQSVAEAAPLRWSWAEWRWAMGRRIDLRVRTVQSIIARPFRPIRAALAEMRHGRLVRRYPWMADIESGKPSWRYPADDSDLCGCDECASGQVMPCDRCGINDATWHDDETGVHTCDDCSEGDQ